MPYSNKTWAAHKTPENQHQLVSSLVVSSNIQVHRQVLLNNANISETTKLSLNNSIKNFDSINSKKKNNNNMGQTDLIEMHIATRPDITPVAVWPYL